MIRDRRQDRQQPKAPSERPLFNRPRQEQPLTDKQRLVLQYIAETIDLLNEPPTLLTLSRRFNVSKTTIHATLDSLRKRGYIRMDAMQTRTIELTGKT